MTRREFLRTASTLAAAATLGGVHAHADESKKKLGFALVGLGSLSNNQLAPAFKNCRHAELRGIVTGTPAKADRYQKEYGIDPSHTYDYETFDRIADDDAIDVIYIVLPNGMHHEYVLRAAAAGKHVLCEKPMANSSTECREMIAACEKADRRLAIGYRCQFEPHHLRCIDLARQQKFGDLKFIRAGFGFKIGDPNQWRLDGKLAGGGALMDVGIYALQACRYLSGAEPIEIAAQETKTDPKKFAEVDETIAWTMTMPGDVLCQCNTTYNFGGINMFRAQCDNGWFGLDPAYSYSGIRGKTSEGEMNIEDIDQFAAEMDAFAKVILEEATNRVPGEEGLKDLLAIEAIYRSIREGRTVKVESV